MNIVWFRDDLRIAANPALEALVGAGDKEAMAIYILEEGDFSENGLGSANKVFLHHALESLSESLKKKYNLQLHFFKGEALDVFKKLKKADKVGKVFWNRRYNPTQIETDKKIKSCLKDSSVEVESFKANLICEPWEGLKKDDTPFLVYTPFFKNAFAKLELEEPVNSKRRKFSGSSVKSDDLKALKLLPKRPWGKDMASEWKISEKAIHTRLNSFLDSKVDDYKDSRNFPSIDGTSTLSPYLRFGLICPAQIFSQLNKKIPHTKWQSNKSILQFVKEVYWREYAYHLYYYFPETSQKPLKKQFANFPWNDDPQSLKAWQKGLTGYPIIDAGMRQLWHTGWMHNRVRMVVGSFLTKHLLLPWTEGARWFEDTLVDGDIASNTFGWQWISGCGADAAPYFRIFNPILQSAKFDGDGEYIKKWVPELKELAAEHLHEPWEAPEEELKAAGIVLGKDYPEPIVEHAFARRRALKAYEKVKKANSK